jgi:hypothetical protein
MLEFGNSRSRQIFFNAIARFTCRANRNTSTRPDCPPATGFSLLAWDPTRANNARMYFATTLRSGQHQEQAGKPPRFNKITLVAATIACRGGVNVSA